jgi:hypothetical protein
MDDQRDDREGIRYRVAKLAAWCMLIVGLMLLATIGVIWSGMVTLAPSTISIIERAAILWGVGATPLILFALSTLPKRRKNNNPTP